MGDFNWETSYILVVKIGEMVSIIFDLNIKAHNISFKTNYVDI